MVKKAPRQLVVLTQQPEGHEYWYSALFFILSGVPVYGVLPSTLRVGLNLPGNILKHIPINILKHIGVSPE